MAYKVDFPAPETAVEWTLTDAGASRTEVTYRPTFYVGATGDRSLARVADALVDHPEVHAVRRERRRPGWRHDATEMLAVDVGSHQTVDRLAATVGRLGRPGAYRLFNVDFSRQFRYCLETETDPTPAREPTALRLRTPPTAFADDGGLTEVTASTPGGEAWHVEGAASTVATDVAGVVDAVDPDVLLVSAAALVPALFEAGDAGYRLGREPGYTRLAGESTFESYGRVGHSPARYDVPGRVLVDESNTFFLTQSNLSGLLYLVERSHKPLQEAGWASIGNVLTAIQIRHALREDVLVPWRSWRPEFFKPARTLETADRGGFTFAPDVGVHENVHELDFSSLYPNIMVTRNVSPETVCCDCHPDRSDVPGLGYGICPDDGYLPGVLKPLIDDRDRIKAEIRETEDEAELTALEGRSAAIKWILVSCFGYQGFNNAKFGRIECHEAINAYAREILLDAKDTLERHGWRVVHGIVDSLWVTAMDGCEQTPLDEVADAVTEDSGIRLEYEAAYDWLAFCPRRNDDAGALTRYFGKRAGAPADDPESYKRRGIEARQRSTPPFVEELQLDLLCEYGETRSTDAVCARLQGHLDRLRRGDVEPSKLAIRNRVSKRAAEYSQTTKNVAALERAADLGLDKHPGQDVKYVVVDDAKQGRARVALLHESPDDYDTGFYADEAVRAAESVLSPMGVREDDIREWLASRVDGSLAAY